MRARVYVLLFRCVCACVCTFVCVCICVCGNVFVAALVLSALMEFDACCSPMKSSRKESSLSKSPNPLIFLKREAGEEQIDVGTSQKSPAQL
jgi:hypothetical protein